jgi:hypothetical protein
VISGPAHDESMLGGRRMHVGTFLVMRAFCVFDAVLLLAVALILARFMQHPAGLGGAALCCVGAGISLGTGRWLDRQYGSNG